MFCRKCGKELRENAVFCDQCGEKVEVVEEAIVVENEVIDVTTQPVEEQQVAEVASAIYQETSEVPSVVPLENNFVEPEGLIPQGLFDALEQADQQVVAVEEMPVQEPIMENVPAQQQVQQLRQHL